MTARVNLMAPRMAAATRAERRTMVSLVEAAGLDGVAVGDHVSFFTGAGNDGLGHPPAGCTTPTVV